MSRAIGVPVVSPSKTPERISTRSFSARGLVMALWPGLRRSSSFWMSSTARAIPGGAPSITTPMPGPWLSPNVVTVRILPNVLPGTFPSFLPCPGLRARDQVRLDRVHPLLGIQQADGDAILLAGCVEKAHHDAVPFHAASFPLLGDADPRDGGTRDEHFAAAGQRMKIQPAGKEHENPDGQRRPPSFRPPVKPSHPRGRGEQQRV